MFRARATRWSRVTGRGAIDWDAFMTRLNNAEFREYSSKWEAIQSIGYAGRTNGERWIFGVAGRSSSSVRRSAIGTNYSMRYKTCKLDCSRREVHGPPVCLAQSKPNIPRIFGEVHLLAFRLPTERAS